MVEHILRDPEADSGGKGKSKRVEKMARKKVKTSPPFPPRRLSLALALRGWVEHVLHVARMQSQNRACMYNKKTKNEKSKDYCKADSEERVLFFFIKIFIYIYITVRLAQRAQV